jgi:hypothetical protein
LLEIDDLLKAYAALRTAVEKRSATIELIDYIRAHIEAPEDDVRPLRRPCGPWWKQASEIGVGASARSSVATAPEVQAGPYQKITKDRACMVQRCASLQENARQTFGEHPRFIPFAQPHDRAAWYGPPNERKVRSCLG